MTDIQTFEEIVLDRMKDVVFEDEYWAFQEPFDYGFESFSDMMMAVQATVSKISITGGKD